MRDFPRKPMILNKEVLLLGGWKSREAMWKSWSRMWDGNVSRNSRYNSPLFWHFCDARAMVRSQYPPYSGRGIVKRRGR